MWGGNKTSGNSGMTDYRKGKKQHRTCKPKHTFQIRAPLEDFQRWRKKADKEGVTVNLYLLKLITFGEGCKEDPWL